MNGSNVVVPLLMVLMVLEAAFVPHQLLVTGAAVPLLLRLLPLPPLVVLPASRLKFIVSEPLEGEALLLPLEMPPPLPVALFPVICTFISVILSVQAPGQPLLRVFP